MVVNRQIIVDNTPPRAEVTIPEADTVVNGNLKIVGTATDSYFDSYELHLADGANPAANDWQPIEGRSITPIDNGTLRQFATTTVDDGIYSFRLKVTDKVGQVSTVRRTITIDNAPPQIDIVFPEEGTFVTGTVAITGTASDINFKRYEIQIGSGAVPANWETLTENTAPRKANVLFTWESGDLEGEYTLKLIVEDLIHDQVEQIRHVTVDNTFPRAEITVPEPDAIVNGNLKIVGTATDNYFDTYELHLTDGTNLEAVVIFVKVSTG